MPAAVAMSLGIYFAERNKGAYRVRFITLSRTPSIFSMLTTGTLEPFAYMMHVLGSERYSKIAA